MSAAAALTGLGAALLCAALLALVLTTPAAPGLEAAAAARLSETGVSNPVTAVLLDYRGYDTFLELVIVLLAVAAVGALAPDRPAPPPIAGPVARATAAVLAPATVLVAGYLLWNGSSKPGGAFQAGAVLAGALVLMEAALDRAPVWRRGAALRWGAAAGPGAFLSAGLAGLGLAGQFLNYPGPEAAYAMILSIEAAATVSIAISLAALLAAERERAP